MNDNQLLAISEELVDAIKESFPSHAEFNFWVDHLRDACIIRICWKLNNDKDRPNKFSRIILIVISREAIEDSDYKNRKQLVLEKFKSFIQENYKSFIPNHDAPRYQSPPTEEWLLDNKGLN